MSMALRTNLRPGIVLGLAALTGLLLSWSRPAGSLGKQLWLRIRQSAPAERLSKSAPRNFSMPGPPSLVSVPIRQSLVNAEDKMEIVYGKIREILPESDGRMYGFVIDGGLEVHFPKDRARQVVALVPLGSRLEICGNPYRGPSGDPHIDAKFIMNLDSKRSVNLQGSPPPKEPEMSSLCSSPSTEAASLAPPQTEGTDNTENYLRRKT
jgi:hypothetical protein